MLMASANEKRKAARELLENLMAQPLPETADFGCLDELSLSQKQRDDLTYDDVFWIQLVQKSLHGDMKATQEILDRRYGKSPQYIEQTNVNLTYVDFLSGIEAEENPAQSLLPNRGTIDMQPVVVPQVEVEDLTVGGGSTVNLMDDLGLFTNDSITDE